MDAQAEKRLIPAEADGGVVGLRQTPERGKRGLEDHRAGHHPLDRLGP
jgi:hypothetical protein